ncbi:MAG: cell division protein ZipA [Pseudomonadales bacterium]
MEVGLREWMLIAGSVLVIIVIADGIRRMRAERRNNIKLSKRTKKAARAGVDYDDVLMSSELPGGHARVIARDLQRAERDARDRQEAAEAEADTDVVAPVLMDSVRQPRPVDLDEVETAVDVVPAQEELALESFTANNNADDDDFVEDELLIVEAGVDDPLEEEKFEHESSELDDVLVVNVISKSSAGFAGRPLLELLLACDVRFGDMDIFHRYEHSGGKGRVQFSIANLMEPGTFDVDNMDDFSTRGLGFFMRLPGPRKPMDAFTAMVETADAIARNLGGELRDEDQSVVRKQTLEHLRQRIHDFERKQLTRKT